MTIPAVFVELSKYFYNNGFVFYAVGGAVRDYLLNKKTVEDWDFATDAQPIEVINILKKCTAENISKDGINFGTIKATLGPYSVEITTFRNETYQLDSRKPQVMYGKTIEEDLSRRDFTINAIAFDLNKRRLIDPFEGKNDLERKIIKAVGSAEHRLEEDPLRILRAIRFAATLNFQIDQELLEAMELKKDRLAIVSSERITQELDKILLSSLPSRAIKLMVENGVIEMILPELVPTIELEFDPKEHKDIYHHILQVLDQTPAKLELRWCALLHDIAKPLTRQKVDGEYHFFGHEIRGAKIAKKVLERLKYPKAFVKYVVKLVSLHQRITNYEEDWTDGGIRRFVRDAGECLEDLFVFAKCDATGSNEKKIALYAKRRQKLKERIDELNRQAEIAKIKSPLDGNELMKLFQRPSGPWIKPIKEHLLSLVLDGKLGQDDKEQAIEIAKKLVAMNRNSH